MRREAEYSLFGKKVKHLLIEKNMTNKELAKRIGMAESTVCDVISGRNNREKTKQLIINALEMNGDIYAGKK